MTIHRGFLEIPIANQTGHKVEKVFLKAQNYFTKNPRRASHTLSSPMFCGERIDWRRLQEVLWFDQEIFAWSCVGITKRIEQKGRHDDVGHGQWIGCKSREEGTNGTDRTYPRRDGNAEGDFLKTTFRTDVWGRLLPQPRLGCIPYEKKGVHRKSHAALVKGFIRRADRIQAPSSFLQIPNEMAAVELSSAIRNDL